MRTTTRQPVQGNGKKRRNGSGSSALTAYMESIAGSRPLAMEEEAVLARRIRQQDEGARNELIEANLRFVVSVAKEYQNRGLSLEELVSAGNMGLIAAAKRFDESKGYKFITYAVWWIRQSILQALAEETIVRLPTSHLNMVARIGRLHDELQQREVASDAAEIARVMGFSEEKVEQYLATPQTVCCSLEAPLDEEDGSMLEHLSDENQTSPEEEALQRCLRRDLDAALKALNVRETEIVKLYFGLDGEGPMTLEQIGQRYHLTRERVRQIRETALGKLRCPATYDRLRSYLEGGGEEEMREGSGIGS